MRIVVDARTMGSRPSGIGIYLYDFLKKLTTYKEFTFILVSDVASSEYIKYFENIGIEIRLFGKQIYKSAGVYTYFRFLKKELEDIKPDVFWEVNTLIPIRLRGNYKTMITIHDMFPITHMKYFGIIYGLYFKFNLKKTLKYTDMILYNSGQSKITTEKYYKCAKKIKNCIGYIISNPLSELPDTKQEDYFLYIGNMEKRKGVDLLLKGYERYRMMGGEKRLIIAGKMLEESIEKLLHKVQSDVTGIEYKDYVSQDTKNELFKNCACFVFPSKAEGFGMPILEIMKYSKPIIISNLEIYDELQITQYVNKFDIHCRENIQIQNLAHCMLNYKDDIKIEGYRNSVKQFSPDILGKRVKEFILEDKVTL